MAAGAVLAACGSQSPSTGSLRRPIEVGRVGNEIKLSFPHPPKKSIFTDPGTKQPQYGAGIRNVTIYASGIGPNEVSISIDQLTNMVPIRRVDPFLRSFLASSHGGRIIKWFGLPAAEEFVPGCNPSGQCVGYVGNLVVLRGTTLFFVFTTEGSRTLARDELRTFRIVGK